MIRLTSRRNDRENRRRRPFPGLVHTPGTPLLHHLGGIRHGWRGFAPGPQSEDLDPGLGKDRHQGGLGRNLDQNVLARYAAVARASILDASRVASFPPPHGPVSGPPPYLAQTWHSKIGIRDECRK